VSGHVFFDHTTEICCFSSKYAEFRSKGKDLTGLLYQCASTINVHHKSGFIFLKNSRQVRGHEFCDSAIDFTSFYDFSIIFFKCSDSMVFFLFLIFHSFIVWNRTH
jgi:hypothetical protein